MEQIINLESYYTMKNTILIFNILVLTCSCNKEVKQDSEPTKTVVEEVKKSTKQIKDELVAKGVQTFDYIDEKTQDTILMQ